MMVSDTSRTGSTTHVSWLRSALQPVVSLAVAVGSGLAIAAAPASAATFALSQGGVQLFDFNTSAATVGTSVDNEDGAIARNDTGLAAASSDAAAIFLADPTSGNNQTLSFAEGSLGDYDGFGNSTASLFGIFNIDSLFSFSVLASLVLEAQVDNPKPESAEASGSISLLLEDITDPDQATVVDELFFSGRVSDELPLSFSGDATDGFSIDPDESEIVGESNGKGGLILAQISASYRRSFDGPRTLKLTEVKRNQARVSAPEPGILLALMAISSSIGALKLRQKVG